MVDSSPAPDGSASPLPSLDLDHLKIGDTRAGANRLQYDQPLSVMPEPYLRVGQQCGIEEHPQWHCPLLQ